MFPCWMIKNNDERITVNIYWTREYEEACRNSNRSMRIRWPSRDPHVISGKLKLKTQNNRRQQEKTTWSILYFCDNIFIEFISAQLNNVFPQSFRLIGKSWKMYCSVAWGSGCGTGRASERTLLKEDEKLFEKFFRSPHTNNHLPIWSWRVGEREGERANIFPTQKNIKTISLIITKWWKMNERKTFSSWKK